MYSLQLVCRPEESDLIAAELWDCGTLAISETDTGTGTMLIAGFDTDKHQDELLRRFDSCEPVWQQETRDWLAETRLSWPAREVGRKLFLALPWSEETTPPERMRLIHNPGMASGTGEHPCTQLALEALEKCVQVGDRVVDVGTGSGILSLAARLLGARFVVSLDTDADCLATARENFGLNGLSPCLIAGSADCIREQTADLTVVNISGTVIVAVLDELLCITKPDGILILTGFTEGEAATFLRIFGEAVVTENGEWRCLAIQLSSNVLTAS